MKAAHGDADATQPCKNNFCDGVRMIQGGSWRHWSGSQHIVEAGEMHPCDDNIVTEQG